MDEFQNGAKEEPTFFSDLEHLCEKYRKITQMLLVLTGSAASAKRQIIEEPSAALFSRKSGQLARRAFAGSVIKEILSDYAPDYTPEDLLTLYALAGGVPKYLEVLVESGSVTKEAIIDAATHRCAYFVSEAEALFRTEFKYEFAVYFEMLAKIAAGKASRSGA